MIQVGELQGFGYVQSNVARSCATLACCRGNSEDYYDPGKQIHCWQSSPCFHAQPMLLD